MANRTTQITIATERAFWSEHKVRRFCYEENVSYLESAKLLVQ